MWCCPGIKFIITLEKKRVGLINMSTTQTCLEKIFCTIYHFIVIVVQGFYLSFLNFSQKNIIEIQKNYQTGSGIISLKASQYPANVIINQFEVQHSVLNILTQYPKKSYYTTDNKL